MKKNQTNNTIFFVELKTKSNENKKICIMSLNGKQYFGGCEGGASHSKVVILDQDGNLLAQEEGEGTNQWIVGTESFLVFNPFLVNVPILNLPENT